MSASHTTTTTPTNRKLEPLTCRIVTSIAAVKGVPPTELNPPLYQAIDPTALERLMDGSSPISVRFSYGEYTVTVRNDETVTVDRRSSNDK